MRVAHLLIVSSVFTGACAERVPLPQRIGESTGTSTPPASSRASSAPHDVDAAAPDPELYLLGKSTGPCGLDRLPVIEFGAASTDPEEAQVQELRDLARCLTVAPYETTSIVLVGYTDVVGTVSGNLTLGLERAQSVMRHLVHAGVAPGRIVVASAGELQRPSARWGFRAPRVEVLVARGGPARADETPIARGIDAQGLLPRPRPAQAVGGTPSRTAPPPAPTPAPRRAAPAPTTPRGR